MGVVYQARDERLEREVALKVLPVGTLADETARKRFRKEALALSQLNHPNIATVHDSDTREGVDFLVMELIPGATLAERLAVGPLTEKEISRLGGQLAQGLAAAHEQGVVHRDLKPGNVRVTPDGRLKILDFGLATLRRPVGESASTVTAGETGVMAGTLPYMAPEQLRGEKADARSDIYAAGVALYEMTTGRRPFSESSGPQLVAAILQQTPPAPSALSKKVSPALELIILKALDKEPERRYQSARELAVDLERLTGPVAAATPKARGRRRWLLAAAALAALEIMREEPERRQRMHSVAEHLRQELRSRGYWTLDGGTPIVPIIIPNAIDLFRLCRALMEEGIYANPVLRPAARHNLLRITCTAAHTETHVDRLLESIARVSGYLDIDLLSAPSASAEE
jgi:hypothetical protein